MSRIGHGKHRRPTKATQVDNEPAPLQFVVTGGQLARYRPTIAAALAGALVYGRSLARMSIGLAFIDPGNGHCSSLSASKQSGSLGLLNGHVVDPIAKLALLCMAAPTLSSKRHGHPTLEACMPRIGDSKHRRPKRRDSGNPWSCTASARGDWCLTSSVAGRLRLLH